MLRQNLRNGDSAAGETTCAIRSDLVSRLRPRLDTDISVLRQLVTASKEAEGLIACVFELHFISAAPLQHIWDKLARAIKAAQKRLQQHDQSAASNYTDEDRQGGL
jgi:hypothetical protein